MHGTSDIKFTIAQQTNAAYNYQKTKENLMTNADVLFNISVLDLN